MKPFYVMQSARLRVGRSGDPQFGEPAGGNFISSTLANRLKPSVARWAALRRRVERAGARAKGDGVEARSDVAGSCLDVPARSRKQNLCQLH